MSDGRFGVGRQTPHRSSRPDGNIAKAMRPALLENALQFAPAYARQSLSHRSLGENFFRRMLDNRNRPVKCIFIRVEVGVRMGRCRQAPEPTHVPRYPQTRLVSHHG